MRKAFLTLDTHHEGFVDPQEIVAMYGTHIQMDYDDLMKIMEQHNSQKDGTGRLNYADFSKWVGNEIHNLASFIFRHDSKKNPGFEKHVRDQENRKGVVRKLAAEAVMTEGDFLTRLILKIR